MTNIVNYSPSSFIVMLPVVGKNSKPERATHAKAHFMYVPALLLVLFCGTCFLQQLQYLHTSFVASQSVILSNYSKSAIDVVCTICYSLSTKHNST